MAEATEIAIANREAEGGSADKTIFGFWVYLMTDLMVFAVLFAAYAVLRGNTFGGPSGAEIFRLPAVLAETLILLTSSFTCGLALLAARENRKTRSLAFFGITFALGVAFLVLELTEFGRLIREGNGPGRIAFLSSFFTLVGTHGLHITVGLLWMAVSMAQIRIRGLSDFVVSKVERLALFWHFLDVIWIFIFSVVYLMGVI